MSARVTRPPDESTVGSLSPGVRSALPTLDSTGALRGTDLESRRKAVSTHSNHAITRA